MILTNTFFKDLKEYIDLELRKCDTRIYNHIEKIKKSKSLIEYYSTLDAPNIPFIIEQHESTIIKSQRMISIYMKEIKILKSIPVQYKGAYTYLLRLLNYNIQKEVLKGGKYIFPLNVGKLYILVKDRTFNIESINWGITISNVHNVAKKVDIGLYNAYKNKEIKLFEYMNAMKKHLYPVPNKPRYIVYNTDTESWLPIFKRGTLPTKNKYYFKFKPIYYIKYPKKSRAELIKRYSTIDEIIQDRNVGLVNKLIAIKCLFPTYKEYYNDISTS